MDGEREFIKTILLRYGNSRRTREYIGHLYNTRILSEIILNQDITLIQQKILQGFFDDDKKTTFDVHCCFIELLSGNSQYLYYQDNHHFLCKKYKLIYQEIILRHNISFHYLYLIYPYPTHIFLP